MAARGGGRGAGPLRPVPLRSARALPHAMIVVDKVHGIRLVNAALDA